MGTKLGDALPGAPVGGSQSGAMHTGTSACSLPTDEGDDAEDEDVDDVSIVGAADGGSARGGAAAADLRPRPLGPGEEVGPGCAVTTGEAAATCAAPSGAGTATVATDGAGSGRTREKGTACRAITAEVSANGSTTSHQAYLSYPSGPGAASLLSSYRRTTSAADSARTGGTAAPGTGAVPGAKA